MLEARPFVFRDQTDDALLTWKSRLARPLEVDAKDIVITGSAAVGLSLNPRKYPKPFDGRSDVDVAVVSAYHFDVGWRTLRNLGTRRYSLSPAQWNAVQEHVERLIYWGAVATDRILPLLPFAASWLKAREEIGSVCPTNGRVVNLRIYKDFAALRGYVRSGLSDIRQQTFVSRSTSEFIT